MTSGIQESYQLITVMESDMNLKHNYFGKFCIQIQTIFNKEFTIDTLKKEKEANKISVFLLFSISKLCS